MVEFKISTLLVSFLFFVGFIIVGTNMMMHAFDADPITQNQMNSFRSYYGRVNTDINGIEANVTVSSGNALENVVSSFLNTITLGYYQKVLGITRTFNYITNGETGMFGEVNNVFRDIIPPEVFILIGLAFAVLILFTIFSLTFYRRI